MSSAADQLAIERLHYDYVGALDDPRGPQSDLIAQCFTNDAHFVGGVVAIVVDGNEEIGKMFGSTPASGRTFESPTHHFLTNIRIDVDDDGEHASSTAYLYMFGQPPRSPERPERPPIARTSRYANRCRKIDGRWLFEEMVISYQYGQEVPA